MRVYVCVFVCMCVRVCVCVCVAYMNATCVLSTSERVQGFDIQLV